MMPLDAIRAHLYLPRSYAPAEAQRLYGDLLRCFGDFRGGPLSVAYDDESGVLLPENLDQLVEQGMAFTAKHEATGRAIGQRLWTVEFRLNGDLFPGGTQLAVEPLLYNPGRDTVAAAWELLMHALPRFTLATSPSLAACNGVEETEDEEDIGPDAVPPGEELMPGELPPFFAPWTYLGPDRLDAGLRRELAALPAYKTEPLGEGWLVQAVPDLYAKPAPGFVAGLRRLGGKGVGYRQNSPE